MKGFSRYCLVSTPTKELACLLPSPEVPGGSRLGRNMSCQHTSHLLCVARMLQSLYDTPGVHLHHRMAAAVHPDDLPQIAPRRRLRGSVVLAPSLCETDDDETEGVGVQNPEGDLTDASAPSAQRDGSFKKMVVQFDGRGSFEGTSLFWGGLVRIDVLQVSLGGGDSGRH